MIELVSVQLMTPAAKDRLASPIHKGLFGYTVSCRLVVPGSFKCSSDSFADTLPYAKASAGERKRAGNHPVITGFSIIID